MGIRGSKLLQFGAASLAVFVGLQPVASDAAAISSTNSVVILRVGDGSALAATGTAVFLDEYAITYTGNVPTGAALTQTIPVNNAGAVAETRLTLQGTGAAEGGLSRTVDGNYLTFGGYDSNVGGGVSGGSTRRMAGRVALSTGTVELDGLYGPGTTSSNNALRSVVGTTGDNLYLGFLGTTASGATSNMIFNRTWGGGSANAGTQITSFASTGTASPFSGRRLGIYNSQLYLATTGTAAGSVQGMAAVGTGLPTTTGNTVTPLPGFPTTAGPTPFDFFFADANTLYLADDRTTAGTGGLQKWKFDGSNWNLVLTKSVDTTNNSNDNGIRGLSGSVDASGNVVLFATTTYGTVTPNFLVGMTDTLGNTDPNNVTVNSLAGAGTNQTFRGLNAIGITVPEPGTFALAAAGGMLLVARRRRRNA